MYSNLHDRQGHGGHGISPSSSLALLPHAGTRSPPDHTTQSRILAYSRICIIFTRLKFNLKINHTRNVRVEVPIQLNDQIPSMSVNLFLVGLILRTRQIYENPIAWNSVAHLRENYNTFDKDHQSSLPQTL